MEQNTAKMPLLGARFPEMHVMTTHGEMTLPNHYEGKWFILFSHPGDFTPVCTTEFVAFAEKADDFKALNTELIGLSVDQVVAHMKWVEWIDNNSEVKVPFPVIADELGKAANQLGMIHESVATNTVRAVFIVDDKGLLRLMMYYPHSVGRSVDEILRALKALQVADKHGVAAPENFPNNNWLGKNVVIIPPASTEDEKAQRLKGVEANEFKSKDWWLCYKELKE